MRARCAGSLLTLLPGVAICFAQPRLGSGDAAAYVEIKLPVGVRSETIFARFVLDDDFGGWVQPRPDVSSYFISTIRHGAPATRFRAVAYAPGCAIQTIDLRTLGPAIPQYSFVCQPLRQIRLTGALIRSDLDGREISLEVKYAPRWAESFLGPGAGGIPDIPIGEMQHAFANGSFEVSLPDLSEDPLAGVSDHAGELQILGRDRASGKIVVELIPTAQLLRTRMGGLQIRKEYPEPVEFAPCSAHGLQVHDPFGFAIRLDSNDACGR